MDGGAVVVEEGAASAVGQGLVGLGEGFGIPACLVQSPGVRVVDGDERACAKGLFGHGEGPVRIAVVGFEEDRVGVRRVAGRFPDAVLGAQEFITLLGPGTVAQGLLQFAQAQQVVGQGAIAMAAR